MSSSANRILLIEDDQRLVKSVSSFLTSNGFVVRHLSSVDNLEVLIEADCIDLILCDVMLPGTNGFDIAKKIRHKFSGPYIFLTALSSSKDQLKGFELGADDYIQKPVEPEILLARINAHLRKHHKPASKNIIKLENLFVDSVNRYAKVDDEEIPLSRNEFNLLWLLVQHPGEIVSREFLFQNTVGREYDGLNRTVDGRVSRLRKRLEQYEHLRCKVDTLWGQGYILSVKE